MTKTIKAFNILDIVNFCGSSASVLAGSGCVAALAAAFIAWAYGEIGFWATIINQCLTVSTM